MVTTINHPTRAIRDIARLVPEWNLLVVGDRKTPKDWKCEGVRYLSVDEQVELGFSLSHVAPYNHYVRKNIGYLFAIEKGANVVLETDDDNIPFDWYPGDIAEVLEARLVNKQGWENIYTHFSKSRIWPRGFPLELINESLRSPSALANREEHRCPIQQYLADENPDVDAVFRMTTEGDQYFQGEDVVIGRGTWCPFNSQNTLWMADAFPYLYLPCTATFRMTDIWRSFIAQVCVYAANGKIAFRKPSMFQKRNEHSLIRDFADEVSGYLNNAAIMAMLSDLDLSGTGGEANLHQCYRSMIDAGYLQPSEMNMLDCWLADLQKARQTKVRKFEAATP